MAARRWTNRWTPVIWVSLIASEGLAQEWRVNGDEAPIVHRSLLDTGLTYYHPANIIELQNGELMVVTVAGEEEGEATKIVAFISSDGGLSWPTVRDVTPVTETFDPTVSQAEDGTIVVYYYEDCCDDQKFRVSTDDGRTWGPEQDVDPDDLLEAGEQSNCLIHPNGSRLCGFARNVRAPRDGHVTEIPAGALTDPSRWVTRFAVDQFWNPDFLVVRPEDRIDGRYRNIVAVMRTEFHNLGDGSKFARSTDGGRTWTPLGDIGYSDPGVGCTNTENNAHNAAQSLVSLDIEGGGLLGWHLLASGGEARFCANASDCSQDRCQRHFMRVFASSTGEVGDWSERLEIRESSLGDENADCSIMQSRDGYVHLVWTGRGATGVRYMKIDPYLMITGRPISEERGDSDGGTVPGSDGGPGDRGRADGGVASDIGTADAAPPGADAGATADDAGVALPGAPNGSGGSEPPSESGGGSSGSSCQAIEARNGFTALLIAAMGCVRWTKLYSRRRRPLSSR